MSAPADTPRCPVMHGDAFAADPAPTYAQLRAMGPIASAQVSPGVDGLIVTDYQAALHVLRDTHTFSKDSRLWKDLQDGLVPPSAVRSLIEWRDSVLYNDNETHAHLRWSMDDCLGSVNTHTLRRISRGVCLTLIARFAAHGRADLMTQYADMVPLLVLAELLGVSEEDSSGMVKACQGLVNAGPDAEQAAQDLAALLAKTVAHKQKTPGDDITSWMIRHPSNLTLEQIIGQLIVVVGAGCIPLSALIAHTLRILLTDAEFASALLAGTVSTRQALEKALRTRSPMANFSVHFARVDTVVQGVPVPAGKAVFISHAAANLDPKLAEVDHRNRSHLAWSAGPHRCPAVGQATLIASTAVDVILDQLGDMELESPDPVPNRPGLFHQCPESMVVRHRPRNPAAITATPTGGTA